MLPRQVLAVAVLAALLLPLALAQEGVPTQTPGPVQCQPPVETCLPDLIPTNPRIDIRDERFPATACTDFINLGAGPTASPFRILLSIDGTPTGEQQASGVYQRGEGEANLCWEGISLVAGPHTMTVRVDSNDEVPEEDESNNARTITFRVAPTPRVDLVIDDFVVTPKEGGVGMNQFFIINLSNVGDAGSPITILSLEDEHGTMANWSVPPLGPGQTWTMAHVTRPEFRPVGSFVARAVVDPLNNVSEIREDNNEALLEYTVLDHPAPDYRISDVTVTGNRTANRGIRIDATVENVGDRVVRGAAVRIEEADNASSVIAKGITYQLIFPGQTATVQFYLVLPAGTFNLTLVVDHAEEVAERNESNNEWPLQIEIADLPVQLDRPNLIVERVYAMPEDPRPGEMISVGALVHNVGTKRANATSVHFFVDDAPVGSAQIPALAPDAYYSAYIPWTASEQGAYRFTAGADHLDRIVEIDEEDNALDLDFLVETRRPTPQQPTPPPTTPTQPTTPTPATPTPSDPTTPTTPTTPTNGSRERIAVGDLIVTTAPAPGGATGVISVSLRNPNLVIVPSLTVAFKVDGDLLVERLSAGIAPAGTIAVTTGEMEIPAGKHTVSAEVRIVGSTAPSLVRTAEYEQEAGPKEGIPGFEVAATAAAVALAIALALRRPSRPPG